MLLEGLEFGKRAWAKTEEGTASRWAWAFIVSGFSD
jgi:hypothetical protein